MGTLRLNVPVSAARLVLPAILPRFLADYPDIRVEVVTEESFVDVLAAGCDAGIRGRFRSGVTPPWEFERNGKVLEIGPDGPLLVAIGGGTDVAIDAAIAGTGIVHRFEARLRPALTEGSLEPVVESWWQTFGGPFLCYSGRRLVPTPLKAFIDLITAPSV